MKKLLAVVVMMLLATMAIADIADYQFRVTTELDANGQCTNWQPITALFELDAASNPVITAQAPAPNPVSTTDNQEWYVETEDGLGWYTVAFLASAAGVSIPQGNQRSVYWFSYSLDGTIWSDPSGKVILKPGKPVAQ